MCTLFQHFLGRGSRSIARKTVVLGLNQEQLGKQNQLFAGTGGVSEYNFDYGFLPAFMDRLTGRVELSRYADGSPSPMHLLDGLPDEWVATRDSAGRITALKQTVVAGFVCRGRFYTRAEAAAAVKH